MLAAALGFDIGGDPELYRFVMQVIDKDSSGTIEFSEFLAYVPFFIKCVRGGFGPSFHLFVSVVLS